MREFLVGLIFLALVAVFAGIVILLYPLFIALTWVLRFILIFLLTIIFIWLLGKLIIFIWEKIKSY